MQRTQPGLKEDTAVYPVMVYIHSGDFSSGTSQAQPGHVLTLQDVVVVTFNYRLGALGKFQLCFLHTDWLICVLVSQRKRRFSINWGPLHGSSFPLRCFWVCKGLNPTKLAYIPMRLDGQPLSNASIIIASAFNQLCQFANSPSSAYCYAELAVLS